MAVSCKAVHRPACSQSAVSASYARLSAREYTVHAAPPSRMLVLAFGRRRQRTPRGPAALRAPAGVPSAKLPTPKRSPRHRSNALPLRVIST
jgi:hypothetical protein